MPLIGCVVRSTLPMIGCLRAGEVGPVEAIVLSARLVPVIGDASPELLPVWVIRDKRVRAAGRRLHNAIVYDWGFELNDRQYEQRSFVLLDDGFQINQPVIFPPEQQGWWYCDLVRVTDAGDVVMVEDLWIDVIVGPDDHPYRVLDLDEYAAAAESGALSFAELVDGLNRTQRFLDRHLNRRHAGERRWPDFPPETIRMLSGVVFPQEWSAISG